MTVSVFGKAHSATGATVYGVFRDLLRGGVYSSNADKFETYNAANLQYYAIACTEEGASRFYSAQTPFTASTYWWDGHNANIVEADFYVQAGASPAEGDAHIGSQEMIVEPTYGWRMNPFNFLVDAAKLTANSITTTSFPSLGKLFTLVRSKKR